MRIIGLTGSIAMGKSTAASMLRRMGVPVHDADATVHKLLAKGGAAVPQIERCFPGTVKNGVVDRQALGKRVFGDPLALKKLEAILHPLVRLEEQRFLKRQRQRGKRAVALDIPLLFETRGERRCDEVMVVSAPRLIQMQRIFARPGMSASKLAGIESRQMKDADKRRRADHIIPTGLGRRPTWAALRHVLGRSADMRNHDCEADVCGSIELEHGGPDDPQGEGGL